VCVGLPEADRAPNLVGSPGGVDRDDRPQSSAARFEEGTALGQRLGQTGRLEDLDHEAETDSGGVHLSEEPGRRVVDVRPVARVGEVGPPAAQVKVGVHPGPGVAGHGRLRLVRRAGNKSIRLRPRAPFASAGRAVSRSGDFRPGRWDSTVSRRSSRSSTCSSFDRSSTSRRSGGSRTAVSYEPALVSDD
jgi:hypothetical protein